MGNSKKFKWTELAKTPNDARWKILTDFIQNLGIDVEYSNNTVEPDQFEDSLNQSMIDYQGIRIGSPYGEKIVKSFSHDSSVSQILGAGDCIIKSGENWWVRSCLFHGLQRILEGCGADLNRNGSALIVGAGAAARVTIAALMKIGFKKFKITNENDVTTFKLIAEIKKRYFGCEFEFIPVNELILLSGETSILVNTTPTIDENQLIKELLYFNFLEPGGEVWDLSMVSLNSILLKGANEVGTKTVSGVEIASWVDAVWTKWTFDLDLDREKYELKLRDQLFNK